MSNADVYRVKGNVLEVDVNGRQVRFLYNPETKYALVPAGMYASENDAMDALRESELVDGIFNNKAINEPR